MKEKSKSRIEFGGMKLSTLGVILLIASAALVIVNIVGMVDAIRKYNSVKQSYLEYVQADAYVDDFQDASDYLTENVRQYVINGDLEYCENYFTELNENHRREDTIAGLQEMDNVSSTAVSLLQKSLDTSQNLVDTEMEAMKIAALYIYGEEESNLPQELQDYSLRDQSYSLESADSYKLSVVSLVYGSGYQLSKTSIMEYSDLAKEQIEAETNQAIDASLESYHTSIIFVAVLIFLLFLMLFIILASVNLGILKPLKHYEDSIEENRQLELIGFREMRLFATNYNRIFEENQKNKRILEDQVDQDGLTGILNRQYYEKLKKQLRISEKPLAFILIDVDEFKLINDGNGHEMGDMTLKFVANLLKKSFRTGDYLMRIGGDEFAIILPEMTPQYEDTILHKVEYINRVLRSNDNGITPCSISAGIAYSKSGFDDGIFNLADEALYDVKEQGRCGCKVNEKSRY